MNGRRLLVTMLVTAGLCLPAAVARDDAPPATPTRSYSTTTHTFLETYHRIRSSYVKDVTPERLLSAAVSALLRDVTDAPPPGSLLGVAQQGEDDRLMLNRFNGALNVVRRQHRSGDDLSMLLEEAIMGMMDELDDPYSRYLVPREHQELTQYISGERGRYVGVGIHIGLNEGEVTIVRPIEGSPAYQRGLLSGDRIVAVDGADVRDAKVLEDVSDKIRGLEGTTVTLSIERNGLAEPIDIDIVRRPVTPKNIDYEILGDTVGWLRLYSFSQNSVAEVKNALHFLSLAGARGLVLDLRHNPGGLLEAAIGISDLFLDRDQEIVSVRGRDGVTQRVENAAALPVWREPIVVLVDGGSASASEIVTGALRDNGRAVVVGETTFGKGSVQQVFDLAGNHGGPALRLSTSLYYLPSGVSINVIGVTPDLEIKRQVPPAMALPSSEEDDTERPAPGPLWWVEQDNQLQAAIGELRRRMDPRG